MRLLSENIERLQSLRLHLDGRPPVVKCGKKMNAGAKWLPCWEQERQDHPNRETVGYYTVSSRPDTDGHQVMSINQPLHCM
jgi:hypothetical protein